MEKIHNNKAVIGIVGLGYVGLPLAICFTQQFTVIGYDISKKKIASLSKGMSYINDVTNIELEKCIGKTLYPTNNRNDLKKCNFIMIAVPTPLTQDKKPDLAPIVSATKDIAAVLQHGQTIILESTTYPGTVEEVMKPILEESGLIAGKDFYLAYSPERIDPGNKSHTVCNTPKIVGGMNDATTNKVAALYQTVIKAPVVSVSNIKTAEATKIFENVFRAVNIALVNELSIVFDNMGINTWEVIKAASTKPIGFLAHYPGVGVGGHCIPVDPYYLSYKARKIGHLTRFIELAGEINKYMPIHTVHLALDAISKSNVNIGNATVTVFGASYKPNTSDTRDSPSYDIIQYLKGYVGNIQFYDPYVKEIEVDGIVYKGCASIKEALNCDCIILAVAHDKFTDGTLEDMILSSSVQAVVDGKNMINKKKLPGITVIGIGDGI